MRELLFVLSMVGALICFLTLIMALGPNGDWFTKDASVGLAVVHGREATKVKGDRS